MQHNIGRDIGNTDIMFISAEMDRDFGDILQRPIYWPNIGSVSADGRYEPVSADFLNHGWNSNSMKEILLIKTYETRGLQLFIWARNQSALEAIPIIIEL